MGSRARHTGLAFPWPSVRGFDQHFNYRLDALSRTNGNGPTANSMSRVPSAAARRHRALVALSGAVLLTALLALGTGAPMAFALNIVADIAFGAFLALWAWARSVSAEQSQKVREIPAREPARDFALRRVASS